MTTEQKAKAYDEAIERAKKEWSNNLDNAYKNYRERLEIIFPELKESEDERIRKWLIDFLWEEKIFLQEAHSSAENNPKYRFVMDAIAWLEKQGEFKSIDSDDLATLENWEDFIKENKEKWQLNDWFVEATSLLIQKVKRIENNENINIKGNRVMLNACINALRTVGHSHLSDWLEKQDQVKEYTFKSLPRLLDMIEPSDKAKAYCRKLMDALVKEGYATDAKIVGECLEKMNGENVPMATMDEKQGEQKPANKVEPRFNIGDWIVYDRIDSSKEILYVYDIRDNKYYFNDMCHFSWSIKECDEKCHLWTIRDAKEGDVLYYISDAGIEYIVMNKGININNNVDSYFRYNSIDGFAIDIPSVLSADNDSIIPATKEQYDFLFQKMKEAGYTWDYEKKELRKIEQKLVDNIEPKFKVGDWITNGQLTCKVLSVISKSYELHLYNDDYCHFETDVQNVDKDYHLWTIKDAKDGDVLSNGEMIVIFKHFEEPSYRQHIVAYIGLDTCGDIQITNDTWYLGVDKTKPATKEQRDLLFQKMHEAGLEWNTDKKELRKIEQKSTDKAKPKFKVGDWVFDSIGVAYKIERTVLNVTNNTFGYDIVGGGYFNDDSDVRLWTIKDAKDGDVVVDKSDGTIGIFQSIGHHPDGGSCNDPSYCFLHCRYDDGFFYADFEHGNMIDSDDLIPATKEQRDLLFSKMKEAGYEWDAEKKELKEIDEDGVEYKKHIMSELVNLATDYVKQISEPAWSEEDEKNWRGVIDEIEANKSDAPDYDVKTYDRFLSWLKSIKQRLGGEK